MTAPDLLLLRTAPKAPRTLRWTGAALELLDQTQLPGTVTYRRCTTLEDVRDAIVTLQVRGAPAIGLAAAWGLVLGMADQDALPAERWSGALEAAAARLRSARPTAVNLAWALGKMLAAVDEQNLSGRAGREALAAHAAFLQEDDERVCATLGAYGASVIPDGARILTHCNAGALAVAAWGTATAPMYHLQAQGRPFKVYADETRPVLQGARLTAFELSQAGIDVTLITDSMAAHLMSQGEIDLVMVGTDRVTRNGDVVNKIGTLSVALAAKHFGVPFWVACPLSTYDPATLTGQDVPIEERAPEEVTHLGGQRVAAITQVRNPAFDVTPADLVTGGIITEAGIARPPVGDALAALLRP